MSPVGRWMPPMSVTSRSRAVSCPPHRDRGIVHRSTQREVHLHVTLERWLSAFEVCFASLRNVGGVDVFVGNCRDFSQSLL